MNLLLVLAALLYVLMSMTLAQHYGRAKIFSTTSPATTERTVGETEDVVLEHRIGAATALVEEEKVLPKKRTVIGATTALVDLLLAGPVGWGGNRLKTLDRLQTIFRPFQQSVSDATCSTHACSAVHVA